MKIFPFLIIAGGLAISIEIFNPVGYIKHLHSAGSQLNTAIVVLVGIPVYLCNGADVILLQSLIDYTGISMGTAIAFSLTSTSVCITSLVMINKFIGKTLTIILLGNIMFITFVLSMIIDILY